MKVCSYYRRRRREEGKTADRKSMMGLKRERRGRLSSLAKREKRGR